MRELASAFADDPAVISDKLSDSLSFTVFEAAALQVTFRHNFDLKLRMRIPVWVLIAMC